RRRVHDREDAGALEIFDFEIPVVRKQTTDSLVFLQYRPDYFRVNQSIELAVNEHFLNVLPRCDPLDLQVGWRRPLHLFFVLFEPLDLPVRHAVFVLQEAANPQICGRLKVPEPDLLTDQIGRFANALGSVYKDKPMAKSAMQKDRDGDKG